jgi:gentisate 1,2-dioxygenase
MGSRLGQARGRAIREEYYQRIAKHHMTPLWKVMKNVVTKEPVTRCAPVI